MENPPPPYLPPAQPPTAPPQSQSSSLGVFVVAGIAVAIMIVGTLLYVSARGDLATAKDEIRVLRSQLETSQAEVASTKEKLGTIQQQLARAKTDLKDSESNFNVVFEVHCSNVQRLVQHHLVQL